MVQIEVLVKDRKTGIERTITYKSFLDLQSMYELIGQIDENGNLIEGDPNLQPQHRRKVKSVDAHAEGEGVTHRKPVSEIFPNEEKVPSVEKSAQDSQVIERKKPGPKPKTVIA